MNNLSFGSVYENVCNDEEIFSKSDVYRTINDLLTINGDVEVIVFCPLCVNTFEYKFSLFEHLRTVHHNFLVKVKDRNVCFKECPFCNAKFYGEHLTAKHSLLHHTKIIRQLFVNSNSGCTFCGVLLNTRDYSATIGHIENLHFMDFEKEFRNKFSSTISEMTFSEFINFTVGNREIQRSFDATAEVDAFKNGGHENLCGTQLIKSGIEDFDEASKMNCFNFTELNQQLQNIKAHENNTTYKKKSIMKVVTSTPLQKSVRRVLRFDIPDDNNFVNDNSILKQRLRLIKHFCNEGSTFNLSLGNQCAIPKHCSTPNKANQKIWKIKNDDKENKYQINKKLFHKNANSQNCSEFEFQCGKCRELFKENLELVHHIKKFHKRFGLKVLKPSYSCAICNAKFFKNQFLKKHHKLHSHY